MTIWWSAYVVEVADDGWAVGVGVDVCGRHRQCVEQCELRRHGPPASCRGGPLREGRAGCAEAPVDDGRGGSGSGRVAVGVRAGWLPGLPGCAASVGVGAATWRSWGRRGVAAAAGALLG